MKLSYPVLCASLLAGFAAHAQDDLRDPDPRAFAPENARPLLADRNQPQDFPTLAARDDDGGALDGAAPEAALDRKSSDDEARALFSALAAQNCRITQADVAGVLGPQGFDPEAVNDTLTTLYIEGAASLDAQGYLTIPAALCPPSDPAPSPRDQVLAAFRAADCTISEDQMLTSPGISNLSEAQLLAILGPMRDRGEIQTGTLSATLSADICQED